LDEVLADAMGNAAEKLAPPQLEVSIFEGRDAFVQLEREWNAALAHGPRDEPMLRHEWLRAWIENFAPGATLRTFLAREGKEICAAVPLIETRERREAFLFADRLATAVGEPGEAWRGVFEGWPEAQASPRLKGRS